MSDNIGAFVTLIKCTTKRYLLRELGGANKVPVDYELTMDFQTHYYDFFYMLEGFIDLTSGSIDPHYDDVLLGCL